MSLPVALQLYSVRENVEKDFLGTLKEVKQMGYQGVEFAGLFNFPSAEIKNMLDEVGLVGISAHVPLSDLFSNKTQVINTYRQIGCKYIAIPYLPGDRRPFSEGFYKTIEDIKEIGLECKKQGIVLLYHNHDFEFVKLDNKYALDILYDSVSDDLLKTQVDTCWVNVAGENPSEYLMKYKGRAPVVHLKDFVMKSRGKPKNLYELIGIEEEKKDDSEDDFSFRPVGYGVQDIPSILKASQAVGAKWVVVEQDRPAKNDTPMNSARLSREYLASLGW